jgi:hypothetical protein
MLIIDKLRKSFPQPMGGRLVVVDVPHFELLAGEQVVLRGLPRRMKVALLSTASI